MNKDLNIEFWVILALALLLLIGGIVLYLMLIRRSNPKLFYSTAIISWLLISLFPVVLLFSVFQNSSLTGEFKDTGFGTVTLGGAFGAFFVLLFMGTQNSFKAIKEDQSEETIKTLTGKITNLEDQFKKMNATPKDTRIISESRKIEYMFLSRTKKKILGIITGDMQQIRDIDIWVNSENTNLQMARFYDPSISGLIRYLGAKKDKGGNVTDDIVANDLMRCVEENFPSVKPGLALLTTSGELKKTHNVQAIIHVATVFGEIGRGYKPIENVGLCVQNALTKADEYASEVKKSRISIVFPLFGTGTGKRDLASVVDILFYATLSYFHVNQNSRIDKIYFLAWKEHEKEECLKILSEMKELIPMEPA